MDFLYKSKLYMGILFVVITIAIFIILWAALSNIQTNYKEIKIAIGSLLLSIIIVATLYYFKPFKHEQVMCTDDFWK